MKNLFILVISGFILFSLNSCGKLFDDKFEMTKKAYNGTQLRTDGYYYSKQLGYDYDYYYLVFYRNGIVH